MPNGAEYIQSRQVIIERVNRRDAGEYQCSANTTEGLDSENILVDVLCKLIIFHIS